MGADGWLGWAYATDQLCWRPRRNRPASEFNGAIEMEAKRPKALVQWERVSDVALGSRTNANPEVFGVDGQSPLAGVGSVLGKFKGLPRRIHGVS